MAKAAFTAAKAKVVEEQLVVLFEVSPCVATSEACLAIWRAVFGNKKLPDARWADGRT